MRPTDEQLRAAWRSRFEVSPSVRDIECAHAWWDAIAPLVLDAAAGVCEAVGRALDGDMCSGLLGPSPGPVDLLYIAGRKGISDGCAACAEVLRALKEKP